MLQEQYGDHDWFADVGTDEYGRCVVYVKYMNRETLALPQFTEEGREICVHFLTSKTATRDQFVEKQGGVSLPVYQPLKPSFTAGEFIAAAHEAQTKGIDTGFGVLADPNYDPVEEELSQVIENKSLQFLQNSLEKLEKDCGSFVLQDIFYEIHDGKNAVTNNSTRYPEVRKKLEKLYREYGFDVIYDELDG